MISVIIPCYNEENIIRDSIQKIYNFFEEKQYVFEVVVINNASTDNTLELLNEINKNYQINILNENKKGKGNAIKLGLLNLKFGFELLTSSIE